MKKFLVVLLSLGLIVAFGATASAVDVKVSGSYQVEGAYESNMFQAGSGEVSGAAVWQRVRLQPVFQIAEGLEFTVRIDALEKQWGNSVWKTGVVDNSNSRRQNGTNQKLQENIEFERSYVTFKTAAGVFDVGYQVVGRFGTGFNDWENSGPRVKFTTKVGPVALLAIWDKIYEADALRTGVTSYADADNDAYNLAAIYSAKGIEAGMLYRYTATNSSRLPAGPASNKSKTHLFNPYMKATFGPVYMEAEVAYVGGKVAAFDSGVGDVDADGLGGYILAKGNIGPATIGASAIYIRGDEGTDPTKKKSGLLNSKMVNPALIMMGDDYLTDIFPGGNAYDAGHFASPKNTPAGVQMYSVFGGFKPTPKLTLESAVTYGKFDKTPTGFSSKKMGTELDVTATYKIYDNLSYMVGAGYLWSGDAFKKTVPTAEVGNDYMLMNRLALSF